MFNYGNANEAQKEAISATDGLVLITAGPGTGKTFTLVKRAVYLIQECGIKPEQIMMATFTEKAAKELITRITNELAERNVSVNVNEMYIGTFHSLCLRIIKENLEFTRLKRNYRLLDTFDQKYLVFRNFHKFKNIEGIDELLSKGGSWKRSDEICTYINHLSEEMVDIEALQSDDNPGIRTLGRVLSVYQEMLEEGNLIDFSTIQTECYKLLIDYTDKSAFNWISVIRLPDFITKKDFDWAVETASKKKKMDCSGAEFLSIDEGLCVQIMHIGAFDDEPATVAMMDKYLEENGYVNDFTDERRHHEIYLSDPRKVAPEKCKTVIRHPIKKA